MSKEYVSDQEWNEWLEFLEEYNQKKQIKKEKFQESLLYAIYQKFINKE